MTLRKFNNKNVWLFDLDNTIYPPETMIFDQIDQRMKKYISRKLKISELEAFTIQKKFYKKYGTTLYGLMEHYKFNPEEFLDFVHKVKLKNVKKSKKLYTNIEDLPGRKIIYTNGDEKYAKKILTALGIIFLFEDIYDIKKANYLPKPRMKPLKKLLENYDLQPSNCVYFEDLEKNLKPAHKIGITTVHISSKNKKDNQTFIDFRFKTIIKALDVIKKSFIEGRKNEF